MNIIKYVLLVLLLISFEQNGIAQTPFLQKMKNLKSAIAKSVEEVIKHKASKDSVVSKSQDLKVNTKDTVPVLTKLFKLKKHQAVKLEDTAKVKLDLKNTYASFKNGFQKSWNKTFVDFKHNEIYFLAGMNLSKQNINSGDYNSNFNYALNDFNKDAYKPAYFIGYRVNGKYKEKHNYSFAMSLNKIASGTNYQTTSSLSPFLGTFSKFKADDQFFTLGMAAHYRKQLVFGDTVKRKFYLVAGPSLDTRLSSQSADNLVNGNYHRFVLRGDIGLEFDNQSLYTLFVHYKHGLTSFTKAPISTNLNTIDVGLLIKASDIF